MESDLINYAIEYEESLDPGPPSGSQKFKKVKLYSKDKEKLKPEDAIKETLTFFKENKISIRKYFNWVRQSFVEGEASFEDKDLIIVRENEYTKVIHEPTQIMGVDPAIEDERTLLINAKAKTYLLVDEHFKLWKQTSNKFRRSYL